MPDGKVWFAQNLNYTKDLTYNAYAYEANGKPYISVPNGVAAIGSYWCPAAPGSTFTEDQNTCNTLGALYTWETTMMLDGKYADETKTSTAWDESWVSPFYYTSGAPGSTTVADRNNARGGMNVKDGGRGICPMGWHIPTAREWAQMLDKVDGDGMSNVFMKATSFGQLGTDAANKLKSSATYSIPPISWDGSWPLSAELGLNSYGFNFKYNPGIEHRLGLYYNTAQTANNQCSSVATEYYNWQMAIINTRPNAYLGVTGARGNSHGVRCLKD
jgi:uncharacterized protein (TIGR02145 family)